ncbi:hypothetical protein FF011L_06210 [Roseimaritima multifibrata]|uniref:Uncharacterized protein n=1 Tax=Roseimaritima multifibrata TaxID=1930274 RepID=A0A517MAG9_9BACT|nr:hypothetical protein [Roseimaritima multifibrata]QDS91885.1 hypothetical protein FF011L_06210 [Roseimaritima multifibrata]
MNTDELLTKLLDGGAVLGLLRPVSGDFWLAAAKWLPDDGDGPSLRWCPMFPEHQGHIHHTRYTKATAKGDYLLMYLGDDYVGGIGPALEFDIDRVQYANTRARWLERLAYGDNQARFADFFNNA